MFKCCEVLSFTAKQDNLLPDVRETVCAQTHAVASLLQPESRKGVQSARCALYLPKCGGTDHLQWGIIKQSDTVVVSVTVSVTVCVVSVTVCVVSVTVFVVSVTVCVVSVTVNEVVDVAVVAVAVFVELVVENVVDDDEEAVDEEVVDDEAVDDEVVDDKVVDDVIVVEVSAAGPVQTATAPPPPNVTILEPSPDMAIWSISCEKPNCEKPVSSDQVSPPSVLFQTANR